MSQKVGVVGLGRGPAETEPLRTDNKPDTGEEGGVPAPANGRTGVPSPQFCVWGRRPRVALGCNIA